MSCNGWCLNPVVWPEDGAEPCDMAAYDTCYTESSVLPASDTFHNSWGYCLNIWGNANRNRALKGSAKVQRKVDLQHRAANEIHSRLKVYYCISGAAPVLNGECVSWSFAEVRGVTWCRYIYIYYIAICNLCSVFSIHRQRFQTVFSFLFFINK